MKIPPLGLAVAGCLLSAVCCVQLWSSLLPLWLSLIFLFSGAWVWAWKSDYRRCCAVFLFGIGLANLHGNWALSQRISANLNTEITGRVTGLPVHDEESVRFEFLVTGSRDKQLVGRKIRLSHFGESPELLAGSHWKFQVLLRPPRGLLNPGGYDFERRALEQNIAGTGYVLRNGHARRLKSGSGLDHWRETLSNEIRIQTAIDDARFVQALALGDTRQLTDDDWRVLRATGLTHLIAISGFHVGLVAGFAAVCAYFFYYLFPAVGLAWPRQQAMAISALGLSFAYTALAGFALPTWRTFMMIAVVAIAKMARRPVRISQSLSLALITVLVFDPLAVLSAGFWLSFVGVAWLVWCLPSNPGQARPNRMQQLAIFFQSQWIALLGLLPLSIWFFGQTSMLGPLTNIVGIPWISLLVVPLALLGLLCSFVHAGLAAFFWKSSAYAMHLLWWGLESISDWPQAMLWLPEPSLLALCLSMIGAFILLLPRAVPGKWLSVILFLPLVLPDLHPPEQGEVDIAMIDVGQGLSILVKTNKHALLYDAGPAKVGGFDAGESVVVPALHAVGVVKLDRIIVSHGDNDHAGGLQAVIKAYSHASVMASAGSLKTPSTSCLKAQHWNWDGVDFDILHPPEYFPYMANESSCVLRIEAGGKVALLTGDIGKHIESRLAREQPGKIRADVLQVPHHGSETSSSPLFLDAVDPELALIASGADNRFGHPRKTVVERYRERRIDIFASPNSGWIDIRLGADGLEKRNERRRDNARYWHAPKSADTGYAIRR